MLCSYACVVARGQCWDSSLLFSETGSLVETATDLAGLVGWQKAGIFLSQPPEGLGYRNALVQLCVGAEDLNSYPHAFIFPTEPVPGPRNTIVIMSEVGR